MEKRPFHEMSDSGNDEAPRSKKKRRQTDVVGLQMPSEFEDFVEGPMSRSLYSMDAEKRSKKSKKKKSKERENDLYIMSNTFAPQEFNSTNYDQNIMNESLTLDEDLKTVPTRIGESGFEPDRRAGPLLAEDVSKFDEVYMLSCPNDFDCNRLQNLTVPVRGKVSHSIRNGDLSTGYEMSSIRGKFDSQICLVPSSAAQTLKAVPIKLKGYIVVRESVTVPQRQTVVIPVKKKRVSFPEGLKVRHPLLGADYDHKIDSNGPLKEDSVLDTSSGKKNKRKKRQENDALQASEGVRGNVSVQSEKKKIAKQKSSDLQVDWGVSRIPFGEEEAEDRSDDDRIKSPKKKKRTEDSVGGVPVRANENRASAEESETPEKKKKERTEESVGERESENRESAEDGESPRKKKKKKRKTGDEQKGDGFPRESEVDKNAIVVSLDSSRNFMENVLKRIHKKVYNVSHSSEGPSFDEETTPRKKKKKHKDGALMKNSTF